MQIAIADAGRDALRIPRADGHFGSARQGAPEAAAAKIAQEEPLELVAEDAVDDEVGRRIGRHEQVADARHLVHQDVGHFKDVHHLEEKSRQ